MFFSYAPSQADVHVFKLITEPISPNYPHIARWRTHIKSYATEHDSLPGTSAAGQAFVESSTVKPAAAEEDDIDLFGSDEENEETERIKAERIAAYNARKANKPKAVAKVCVICLDSLFEKLMNLAFSSVRCDLGGKTLG